MNAGNDTIAAISSAAGPAARMIVRLGGAAAFDIAARFIPGGFPRAPGARRRSLSFRAMAVPAWVYAFVGPRSYNGDDLVEFHLPGNPLLAKLFLGELLAAGARAAEPGEFTARAYFNGQMDLTEAEGVAATIAAANEQELSAARRLMSGELARRIAPIIDSVADTLALLEVGIDFSDEDVTFLSGADLEYRIAKADRMLSDLLAESGRFERLSHEPTVVLLGRPNAGKSTLLNVLAGQDRAVVSDVAGTTRDVLSADVTLPRGTIRLLDVAGLEDQSPANDEIHTKMQAHAKLAIEQADHVVSVIDGNGIDERDALPGDRSADLIVLTKLDLVSDRMSADDRQDFARGIRVSAKTGEGLDDLRAALDRLCFGGEGALPTLALNARHVSAIDEGQAALGRAKKLVGAGPEILAAELREALDSLGKITGRISPDDLLGRVFSAFCIGK